MDRQPEGEESPRYTSFLLRCATDARGGVRARLIEVGTGSSHPVAALDLLPDLLRCLLARARDPGMAEGPPDPPDARRVDGDIQGSREGTP